MKIAIVTAGTRGDVQPYVAVGLALQARGHTVTLSAHADDESFIRARGLVAGLPMRGSFREMMESDLGRAWLTSGDSPRKYARYARELFVPLQRAWCEDADAAVEGADAVAFYGLGAGAAHAAERRGLPAVALSPWPMVPSREVAPLGAPWMDGFPGVLKLAAGHLIATLAFGSLTAEHLAHRARVGLPPFRERDILHFVIGSGLPTLHLFSEAVLPRPGDWAPRHEVVGSAFLPEVPYSPQPGLSEFLGAGPPPVYLGFGSMTGISSEALADLATRAARLARVRAIVASGWAKLMPQSTEDVFVIDEVPHDWLFPRVSTVIHHGGVGTFHEGLRAGRPTVIAAFFGDQPFWGKLNEKLGTGPKALRRADVTAESLAGAIREAESGGYRGRAEALGVRIRSEDGAARAAERIEQLVS